MSAGANYKFHGQFGSFAEITAQVRAGTQNPPEIGDTARYRLANGTLGECSFGPNGWRVDKEADPTGDALFGGAVIAPNIITRVPFAHESFTADPPTITVAVDGSAWPNSTSSDSAFIRSMDRTPGWSVNQNKVPSSLELIPQRYAFTADADFQAVFFGDGDTLKMWVDGQRVNSSQVITASQTFRLNMAWAVARRREIIIQAQQFLGCRTVDVGGIAPLDVGSGSLVVIGDSWAVGGLNYSKIGQLWPHIVARKLGFANYYAAGDSGTGYANSSNGPVFGDATRFTADVGYVPRDSWVIVCGSINDAGYSRAAMDAGVESLFSKLAAKFDRQRVLIVGPQWIASQDPTGTQSNENAIFAGADRYGFARVSTNGWFTDLGRYVGADTFHMTPIGHQYFAEKVIPKVRALAYK